ncbi:MAG: hypothetical protein M3Q61_05875 [Chloroflexota bacterium]|nr:hypothetical protein [Chloroflexota bacterium]
MPRRLSLFARGARVEEILRAWVCAHVGRYEADARFDEVLAAIRERRAN